MAERSELVNRASKSSKLISSRLLLSSPNSQHSPNLPSSSLLSPLHTSLFRFPNLAMAERAGFTVTAFILDVSKSMGRLVPDPAYKEESGRTVQKLAWAKEYVCRKLVTLVSTRKI